MNREFTDTTGKLWSVEVISHGKTSGYLNPRVHRPILQFSPADGRLGPRRYVALKKGQPDDIEQLTEDQLETLLGRASSS